MRAFYRIWIAAALFAGTVAAQTVVTGTGDPDIDIAAVQSAVDRGGAVVLTGHFSFDNPPARHGAVEGLMAMVLVARQVSISGALDKRGEMTVIRSGEIPFAVEAPGAEVRIKGLRFVRPRRTAVFAGAAGGLAIESCVIESVEPMPAYWNSTGLTLGIGIHVASLLGLPSPIRPGKPGNIYGKVSIVNNEVSVSERADYGVGIMIVSAGDSERPVEVEVSGNTVRDSNLEGINCKYIGGRVRIERNIVTSSTAYTGPAQSPIAGIHCVGSGSYVIARNRIDMADPNGAGIRVRGYSGSGVVIEHVISDNDVTLSPAEGVILGAGSAGIDARGFPKDNVIKGNRIRGRARAALSLASERTGFPFSATLDRNDHQGFIASPGSGGQR